MTGSLRGIAVPGADLAQSTASYRDEAGDFGPSDSEEWMALLRDPDWNGLGLASTMVES